MNNLDNPPDTMELARSVGLSRAKLHRCFRRVHGVSPFEYLRNHRLRTAMMLLQSGKINVTEAALSVGYANLSYFSKAFKAKSTPMEGLIDEVERQLVQRCTGLLGMAKKSGLAVLGFDQVRDYIRRQEPGLLLEASDGAEDGRNKVHFLAKAIYEDVKVAGALSSAELGMAFGRQHVIHALLEHGSLADAFSVAYRRLTGFRVAPETGWFSGGREKKL